MVFCPPPEMPKLENGNWRMRNVPPASRPASRPGTGPAYAGLRRSRVRRAKDAPRPRPDPSVAEAAAAEGGRALNEGVRLAGARRLVSELRRHDGGHVRRVEVALVEVV